MHEEFPDIENKLTDSNGDRKNAESQPPISARRAVVESDDESIQRRTIHRSEPVDSLFGSDSEDDVSMQSNDDAREKYESPGISKSENTKENHSIRYDKAVTVNDQLFGSDDDSDIDSRVEATSLDKSRMDSSSAMETKADLDEIFGESMTFDENFSKTKSYLNFTPRLALEPNSISCIIKVPGFLAMQGLDELKRDNKFSVKCKKSTGNNDVVESNAKYVKWSDGSFSVIVGGMVFDASESDIFNGYIYSVQKTKISEVSDNNHEGNNLNSLECLADCSKRITLHTDGSGAAHSILASTIATKYNSSKSIENIDNELLPQNPEKLQEEQAKAEQKRLRSLKSQHDSTQRQSSMFSQRRPLLSSDYLDDNDDYDTTNISDFRRQKIAGAKKSYTRYTDDDEDEMKDFIVDEDETFDQEDKFDDNQDSEDIEDNADEDDSESSNGAAANNGTNDETDIPQSKRFKRNVIDSDEED